MFGKRAFGAGVLGAAVMSVLLSIARSVGFPARLELLLGSFFTHTAGTGAWVLGFVLHFALGGFFGLVYAAGFEHLVHRAGVLVGLGFGAVHALFAGLLLLAVPAVHPIVPDMVPAPGPYMANLGAVGVGAFIALHLVFGAMVGELYKPITLENQRFGPVHR